MNQVSCSLQLKLCKTVPLVLTVLHAYTTKTLEHKNNLLLDKSKLNQNALSNKGKQMASRKIRWKTWEEAVLFPLWRENPLFSFRRSNSQWLPELTDSPPSPLIFSAVQAAPCHKNTFPATQCLPACASPAGSFLFSASPCLVYTTHTEGSWKPSLLPCTPQERTSPNPTAQDLTWLRSQTTSTIHTYLEFVHHGLP